MVEVAKSRDEVFHATRLDPDHPWVKWAVASIARTTNKNPAILPNLGGIDVSPVILLLIILFIQKLIVEYAVAQPVYLQ